VRNVRDAAHLDHAADAPGLHLWLGSVDCSGLGITLRNHAFSAVFCIAFVIASANFCGNHF
jgi:hypothetical protein